MSKHEDLAHAVEAGPDYPSSRDQRERKQRVLTQGTPSMAESIAEALVMKDGNMFVVAEPDGRFPLEGNHGLGRTADTRRSAC